MADVFVSYARADKARVAPLVAAMIENDSDPASLQAEPRFQQLLARMG